MKTLHFENRQKNTEHLLLALAKIAIFPRSRLRRSRSHALFAIRPAARDLFSEIIFKKTFALPFSHSVRECVLYNAT